ncbi:SpoIIE family protein phosphatase [Cellulomonas edaphi]|uniref:SpoIIE family protein phosphatase n=1 Tax=Cellulomonas edaphi TaxID=3053468 RepID=A0ABT7S9J0_9CELL|nr:SpoIIE family protein phosphatase [Cellulomons edaphi]MDM7831604.1 SpoIIE family protein phosphatase [Cellulomons edaphi]
MSDGEATEMTLRAASAADGAWVVLRGGDLRLVHASAQARALFGPDLQLDAPLPEQRRGLGAAHGWLAAAFAGSHEQPDPPVVPVGDGANGRWFQIEASPQRDDAGQVHGLLVRATDVTALVGEARSARRQAEAADERARRATDTVESLSTTLLPATLPLLARVDVAAHSLVLDPSGIAGGDWYDAEVLPGGLLALTVGDAVGHGIAAAAAMARLRTVAAAALSSGASLLSTLSTVDSYARREASAFAATACVAILDPATGDLRYVTRGHPSPVVVGADGVRQLASTSGGPLGTGTPGSEGRDRVQDGELLLMFTDGLVQAGSRALGPGVAALERAALDAVREAFGSGDLAEVGGTIVARMGEGGFADDVTLLAVLRRPAPAPLAVSFPARAGTLAQARAAVDAWCRRLGQDDDGRRRVVLGVSEAVANSVEHGYRAREDGHVEVTGRVRDDGAVEICVADTGAWREPTAEPGGRGRGFAMMASVGLEVDVQATGEGTRVTIAHPLRRAVVASAEVPPPGTRTGDGVEVTSDPQSAHVVRADGPIADSAAAAQVEAEVLRMSRNGWVPVTIDLSAVTHLGSAGVRVLEMLVRTVAGLRVVAPSGSPADQTLVVAGMAHDHAVD